MSYETIDYTSGQAVSSLERNKVMRNTYVLLAISLVPTVFGAWLGVNTGLGSLFQGWMGLILFFAGAFGFMHLIQRNRTSGLGVAFLLGFTLFMGVAISPLIARTLNFSNGPELVMYAFGGTAGIFFAMASLASVIKRDLSWMGKFLFVGVLVLIAASILVFVMKSTVGVAVISAAAVGIFSAYMLYDIKQIIDGGETNYISATLALFLDIFNVFQGLLSLLGIFGGND